MVRADVRVLAAREVLGVVRAHGGLAERGLELDLDVARGSDGDGDADGGEHREPLELLHDEPTISDAELGSENDKVPWSAELYGLCRI